MPRNPLPSPAPLPAARPLTRGPVALALGAVAVAGLFGVAACGSSSSGGASTGAPSSSASPAAGSRHQAMQAYTQCLSQHGVTLPARHSMSAMPSGSPGMHHRQPGTPPPGVNPQTWSAAQSACASMRPSRAPKPAGS
jgi:hypothetical protein